MTCVWYSVYGIVHFTIPIFLLISGEVGTFSSVRTPRLSVQSYFYSDIQDYVSIVVGQHPRVSYLVVDQTVSGPSEVSLPRT